MGVCSDGRGVAQFRTKMRDLDQDSDDSPTWLISRREIFAGARICLRHVSVRFLVDVSSSGIILAGTLDDSISCDAICDAKH